MSIDKNEPRYYASRNKKLVEAMSSTEKLAELRRLCQVQSKALLAHEQAKEALKKSEAYILERAVKDACDLAAAQIKGMLMLIESTTQQSMDMGPALVEAARKMSEEHPESHFEVHLSPRPDQTLPLVNRETGEIVSEVRRR